MAFDRAKVATAVSLTAILGMLAACSPPHPHHHDETPLKTIASLDCPASQDDLKLTSGASGAGPCVYTDDDGDKVTLQLVSLSGTNATAALAPFRTAAEAELPAIKPSGGGGATASTSATGDGDHDKVDLDLPGIHIHTNSDGRAEVNAMGVHVDADDNDSHHAVVTVPGGHGHDQVTVNANDGGARIEVHENGSGVRSMFMLASDQPGPNGWKSVGFEARGPEAGPIVVASILSKGDHNQHVRDEAKDLVKHNVGG
jgi:hypothetical protein